MIKKAPKTILGLAWLIVACGPATEAPELTAGKGDAPLGGASNTRLASGVEANLPTGLVTTLHELLRQDWVEDHKTNFFSREVEDKELLAVFSDVRLSRELGDLIMERRWSEARKAYQALREILHNPEALRTLGPLLEQGAYRAAYERYVASRRRLLDAADRVNPGRPAGLPTVLLNVPAERLQVFYRGEKFQQNRVVVGQADYDGYDLNSKTRVGDHTIRQWEHCYGNADYPSWCSDKRRGAFGKWTAMLDRTYQYIHGTVGDGILDWLAIRTAPGSHGCVRNQNRDIERLHEIAPEGSWVRKIYAIAERTMRVKVNQTTDEDDDIFGQRRSVTFERTKHKNIYRYDVQDTGLYYPQTGVAVGYRHPRDAILAPLSSSGAQQQQTECDRRGGTCMKVVRCDGTEGGTPIGTPVPFLGCPGDSSLQCCIP